MPIRRVVITDFMEINVYGVGLSYSGLMFTLMFDKIHQLVQEFKWETHTHTHIHSRGGSIQGIATILRAGRSGDQILVRTRDFLPS